MVETGNCQFAEKRDQKRYCRYAINIIISVDTDSLSSMDGVNQSGYSTLHAGKQKWVMELCQRRVDEASCRLCRVDPPACKDPRNGRRNTR